MSKQSDGGRLYIVLSGDINKVDEGQELVVGRTSAGDRNPVVQAPLSMEAKQGMQSLADMTTTIRLQSEGFSEVAFIDGNAFFEAVAQHWEMVTDPEFPPIAGIIDITWAGLAMNWWVVIRATSTCRSRAYGCDSHWPEQAILLTPDNSTSFRWNTAKHSTGAGGNAADTRNPAMTRLRHLPCFH